MPRSEAEAVIDIFEIDTDDLQWRSAAMLAISLLACLVAFLIWGGPAGVFALGFVLTRLSFPVVDIRNASWIWFLCVGVAATGLAAIGIETRLVASGAVAGIVLLTGFLGARYPHNAPAWGILAIWPVVVLMIAPSASWATTALAFASGALVAGVIGHILGDARPAEDAPHPINWMFLIAKSLAVFLAIPIGFELFPSYPYWLVLTILIVTQDGGAATRRLAIHRGVGTMFGVVLGVALGLAVSESVWLLTGTLVLLVFLQMLFMRANYVLFAMFLTATVVLIPALGGVDEIEAGWSRLASTALGAVISVALVELVEGVGRRREFDSLPGQRA